MRTLLAARAGRFAPCLHQRNKQNWVSTGWESTGKVAYRTLEPKTVYGQSGLSHFGANCPWVPLGAHSFTTYYLLQIKHILFTKKQISQVLPKDKVKQLLFAMTGCLGYLKRCLEMKTQTALLWRCLATVLGRLPRRAAPLSGGTGISGAGVGGGVDGLVRSCGCWCSWWLRCAAWLTASCSIISIALPCGAWWTPCAA